MRLTKEKEETVVQLPVNQLRPFEENPYQVRDDEEMVCLVESIQSQGVLTPVVLTADWVFEQALEYAVSFLGDFAGNGIRQHTETE